MAEVDNPPDIGVVVAINTENQTLTTSNTDLEDITGLSVPVLANTNYIWRAVLPHNANSTPSIDFGLSAPSGSVVVWGGIGTATAAVLSVGTELLIAGDGTDNFMSIGGVLYVGSTAGDFKMQAAQNVSDAGAVIILKGASLRVWQV